MVKMKSLCHLLLLSTPLIGCISINSAAPEVESSQATGRSSAEIQSLREEVKSLRELLGQGSSRGIDQIKPQTAGDEVDYEYVEKLIRATSEVASHDEVTFSIPEKFSLLKLMGYEISYGPRKGANGLAFFEENYGANFKLYRNAAEETCLKRGLEFEVVKEGADSSGDFGSQIFIFVCLDPSQETYQRMGRSETVFLLGSGQGIGYTEVSPFPPSAYSVIKAKIGKQTY